MSVKEGAKILVVLFSSMKPAAVKAWVAEARRQNGASVSTTVASQTRLRPAFHGMRVMPSGILL